MREKTFPWTKIKGNPGAMTVHIGLKHLPQIIGAG